MADSAAAYCCAGLLFLVIIALFAVFMRTNTRTRRYCQSTTCSPTPPLGQRYSWQNVSDIPCSNTGPGWEYHNHKGTDLCLPFAGGTDLGGVNNLGVCQNGSGDDDSNQCPNSCCRSAPTDAEMHRGVDGQWMQCLPKQKCESIWFGRCCNTVNDVVKCTTL